MLKKTLVVLLVFLAVTLIVAACQRAAPPTATLTPPPTQTMPKEWSIPTDEYVLIERWTEIYQDSAM